MIDGVQVYGIAIVVMNEMDLTRRDYCEVTETGAADTTSDSSQLESPALCTPSDHYTWVHHSSGRVLPVGIAHPLKVDHPVGAMATAEDDSEPEEFEDILKGSKDIMLPKHCGNYGSSSKEDQSSEEQNAASSSADTSDSSSSSSDEDENGGIQEVVSPEMIHKEVHRRENKDKGLMEPSYFKPKAVMKSPYKVEPAGQSHSYSRSSAMLPAGKEWHLFVSHSTADKELVRQNVVVPMREQHHYKVKACYHCMPDATRYDDKAIQRDMKNSCIIMIALSPPYLASSRCINEWKLSVKLQQSGICNIVVSAFRLVSRPEPLKSFLYLDFMDDTKRENVMSKLQLEIGNYVKSRLPLEELRSPSPPRYDHQEKEEVPTPLKPDPLGLESSQPFKGPVSTRNISKLSSVLYTGQEQDETKGDYDEQHCGHLEEEFEAAYGYPSQDEEEEQEYDGTEQQSTEQEPVETTDSENEMSSDTDSEEEGDYVEQATIPQVQSHRGKKRCIEERDYVESYDSTAIPQMEMSSQGVKRRVAEEAEEGEVNDDADVNQLQQPGNAAQVASFYNTLAEPNLESRSKSRIFHMRNFNNWVKSVLIRMHLDEVGLRAYVLDLCCGKGGDLLKWKEGGISYLVGADIAATSIEQCSNRYDTDKMKDRRGRPYFEAEFHVADCTQVRLRDVYHNPGMRFNIASCQFSLHYCFESSEQAEVMLRNLCENLKPGGFFIGTTVDSNELVRRFRESSDDNHMCGNSIYSAVPLFDLDDIPLFGAKYNFHLEGVVDVPEYLIHFPLLARMLEVHNMQLVLKQSFHDFFYMRQRNSADMDLLYRMQALNRDTGDISEEEWEAIGLYLVFAFQKYGP